MEVPQDKVIGHLKELDDPVSFGERCHVQARVGVHFLFQEVEAEGKGGLELELKGSAGDLKDTSPAEMEGPAVGASNQSIQLRGSQEGEGHTGLLGFPHPACEHAPEVVTAGS